MYPKSARGISRVVPALCAALIITACLASTTLAQTATVSCALDSTVVDRGKPITGNVTITPTSGSGSYDLAVNLNDNNGRTVQRYDTRVSVTGRTVVAFSLDSTNAVTMQCRVQARGKFTAGAAYGNSTVTMNVVPYPMDYDDYWCNVWGGGGSSPTAAYFTSIKQANVNLGHMTGSDSYNGYSYNVQPNHDFLEGKLWFEMIYTTPTPESQQASYKGYLLSQPATSYGSATARQYLVRPSSLNNASNLASLDSTLLGRMNNSRKYRPLQWNIADEYGLYRYASPFDYDLGPDCISAFVAWLQTRYPDIATLNSTWNTHFTSFSGLSDPIHAATGGEAALILTQEIRDREFPLASSTTGAKNFAPWGDFRTFMDITFVAAMKRCVDDGRSVDPNIKVGFEGAEPATPLSGYDYGRQLYEIGSIEAYDQACAPEYIRSMRYDRYGKRVFSFITTFNSGSSQNNVYTLWYRLLHYGVTGGVIWANQDTSYPANNFFTDLTSYGLTAYATGMAPAFGEFENGLVKTLNLGDWDDSDVALYYSQKSIQINWMIDSEADGKTWINRLNGWEPTNNSMFYVHASWCKALEDLGLKGRFMNERELTAGELTNRNVKVLVLPRVMALSDAEKTAIQNWVNAGGVLIVDNMCGYYDGYLRRQAIASGGGWWDSFLGVTRTNYGTTESYASSYDAFTGSPTFKTPPAGFTGLTTGLTASGLHAVESGVRAGTGTAVAWWNNNSAQPALICKTYGAGKIVYMNVSMYRYGFTSSGITGERTTPSSVNAANIRQLVKNLVALGGVAPKVALKQGWNNPAGNDVYNMEKSLHVEGQNKYLGCVINSYSDGTNDWWGSRSDTASLCFGQAGVTNANATLVLNNGPANVYDVRKGQYLGYGSQFNVTMPVYEGSVFALLPYKVDHLNVDLVQYDPKTQAATLTATVVPASGAAGDHVLRIEVFDASNASLSYLNSKVVAQNGTWTGVIPFAITDNVTNIRVHVTDVTSSLSTDKTLLRYKTDVNGDGGVDVVDLLTFVEAFGLTADDPGFDPTCDFNADKSVDVVDLLMFVDDFGKTAP